MDSGISAGGRKGSRRKGEGKKREEERRKEKKREERPQVLPSASPILKSPSGHPVLTLSVISLALSPSLISKSVLTVGCGAWSGLVLFPRILFTLAPSPTLKRLDESECPSVGVSVRVSACQSISAHQTQKKKDVSPLCQDASPYPIGAPLCVFPFLCPSLCLPCLSLPFPGSLTLCVWMCVSGLYPSSSLCRWW